MREDYLEEPIYTSVEEFSTGTVYIPVTKFFNKNNCAEWFQ